jgi:hypothetical protein
MEARGGKTFIGRLIGRLGIEPVEAVRSRTPKRSFGKTVQLAGAVFLVVDDVGVEGGEDRSGLEIGGQPAGRVKNGTP